MAKFGIGQSVRRTEDDRFLTGQGQYVDDLVLPGQAHAHVLRSPHAHARIERMETSAAAALPGVLAVLTGADYRTAGHKPVPCAAKVDNIDGSPCADPPRWPLAIDAVRHVGDGVTLIVAETHGAVLTAFEISTDGSLSGRRLFADLQGLTPDGICLDAEGAVWVGTTSTGGFVRVLEGGDQAPAGAATTGLSRKKKSKKPKWKKFKIRRDYDVADLYV